VKKQLQIRIHPDGSIDAQTLGVKGAKCASYIDTLEALLEAKTVVSSYTEEYNQSEAYGALDESVQLENEQNS